MFIYDEAKRMRKEKIPEDRKKKREDWQTKQIRRVGCVTRGQGESLGLERGHDLAHWLNGVCWIF